MGIPQIHSVLSELMRRGFPFYFFRVEDLPEGSEVLMFAPEAISRRLG